MSGQMKTPVPNPTPSPVLTPKYVAEQLTEELGNPVDKEKTALFADLPAMTMVILHS